MTPKNIKRYWQIKTNVLLYKKYLIIKGGLAKNILIIVNKRGYINTIKWNGEWVKMLDYIIEQVSKYAELKYFKDYFDWFIEKFELIKKSEGLESNRKNNLHPIRPRKGEIYLIEFGKNIGKELCNRHMGIIIQESLKNSISSTVIVIPISSSPKLYDTHEKILENDVIEGKLNKLPSKAKAEQITCIDKSRLIHKVGKMSSGFIKRLERKILKNLDIK